MSLVFIFFNSLPGKLKAGNSSSFKFWSVLKVDCHLKYFEYSRFKDKAQKQR